MASISMPPYSATTLPRRAGYEGMFGMLLVGLAVFSTVDQAVAPPARALFLGGFAVLTIVNVGAAVAVYIAAALLFSVHPSQGNISWVERPDNFLLLFLTGYLVAGRCFTRTVGRFGLTAVAILLLLLISLTHLIALVGIEWYWLTWFSRMFGIPLTMFVLLRRAALSPREVRALLFIVAVLGLYLATITLLEVLGLYGLILPPWIADPNFNAIYGSSRVGGLAMQAEWNALLISLSVCVVLLRLTTEPIRIRIGWTGVSALCLVAIYFCYTRAAYLGLLAAGIPLLWHRSSAAGLTLKRRILFLAGALGFLALVLVFPSQMLSGRVSDTGNVFFRLNVWAASLGMLKAHPVFGVGFGQFSNQLLPYLSDLGWIPALGEYQGGTLAHNTFISVAAENGLVGLGLYTFIVGGVYLAARDSAGSAWGQAGRLWVAAFTLVYFVNVQFITAHALVPNVIYFGIMGTLAGMRKVTSPIASPPSVASTTV
jgi:O-antigen ligase